MQTSNKELILLVDDDPGNLKRAQTILGEEFRISATTSGPMDIKQLPSLPGRPDCPLSIHNVRI